MAGVRLCCRLAAAVMLSRWACMHLHEQVLWPCRLLGVFTQVGGIGKEIGKVSQEVVPRLHADSQQACNSRLRLPCKLWCQRECMIAGVVCALHPDSILLASFKSCSCIVDLQPSAVICMLRSSKSFALQICGGSSGVELARVEHGGVAAASSGMGWVPFCLRECLPHPLVVCIVACVVSVLLPAN